MGVGGNGNDYGRLVGEGYLIILFIYYWRFMGFFSKCERLFIDN